LPHFGHFHSSVYGLSAVGVSMVIGLETKPHFVHLIVKVVFFSSLSVMVAPPVTFSFLAFLLAQKRVDFATDRTIRYKYSVIILKVAGENHVF